MAKFIRLHGELIPLKIDITYSPEDLAWIASVPCLQGVVTHGNTPSEAARHAEEAIQLHLESLKAHGIDLTEDSHPPFRSKDSKGGGKL